MPDDEQKDLNAYNKENGATSPAHNKENDKTQKIELEKPLEINDQCQVRWRGGEQVLLARVVERRPRHARRKRKKGGSNITLDVAMLKPEEIEYYVHYIDHDRRLDEWVTLDGFLLETLQRTEHTEKKQTSEDSKPRPSRRKSSNHGSNKTDEGSSFSLSGGNWHGGNSGDPSLAALEEEHEEATKVKNISRIVMGCWEVSK
jgi:hypothetical protein